MNTSVYRKLNRRKRRILRRTEYQPGVGRQRPIFIASNIQDELSDHVGRISPGGIRALQLMAQKIGQIP